MIQSVESMLRQTFPTFIIVGSRETTYFNEACRELLLPLSAAQGVAFQGFGAVAIRTTGGRRGRRLVQRGDYDQRCPPLCRPTQRGARDVGDGGDHARFARGQGVRPSRAYSVT